MRKKLDHLPQWLAAAREAEFDVAASPDRTLTIDQAAQRRAVLPDVVRRQMAALAYVRRHADIETVRAGMSSIESLIAIERADHRVASDIRRGVLLGEMSFKDLQAISMKLRSEKKELVSVLTRLDVASRFLNDLPELHLLAEQDEPEPQDRSWIGAEYTGAFGDVPSTRRWSWVGIVAPSSAWSCLRGAPMRDLVRCIMAATLWSDVVSVALTSSQEHHAIRDGLTPALVLDRARVLFHDLRSEAGVERLG